MQTQRKISDPHRTCLQAQNIWKQPWGSGDGPLGTCRCSNGSKARAIAVMAPWARAGAAMGAKHAP